MSISLDSKGLGYGANPKLLSFVVYGSAAESDSSCDDKLLIASIEWHTSVSDLKGRPHQISNRTAVETRSILLLNAAALF